jgi:hypothetical protein
VLPLDHLESDAEVAENGHGEIVEQWPVLSSQFSVRQTGTGGFVRMFRENKLCFAWAGVAEN